MTCSAYAAALSGNLTGSPCPVRKYGSGSCRGRPPWRRSASCRTKEFLRYRIAFLRARSTRLLSSQQRAEFRRLVPGKSVTHLNGRPRAAARSCRVVGSGQKQGHFHISILSHGPLRGKDDGAIQDCHAAWRDLLECHPDFKSLRTQERRRFNVTGCDKNLCDRTEFSLD